MESKKKSSHKPTNDNETKHDKKKASERDKLKQKKELKLQKKLQIDHLNEEVTVLRSQMKTLGLRELINAPSSENLLTEIYILNDKIIKQKSGLLRMEDKYAMLEKMYEAAEKVLEQCHTEAMDSEELEYMMEKMTNKKDDLMTARNFVSEMQKIGYTNLPPKVVDECHKTQLEQAFIRSTNAKYNDELLEAENALKEQKIQLAKVRKIYTDTKKINIDLEVEVEEIHAEIDDLTKSIQMKEREAKDLEKVIIDIKEEVIKAEAEKEKRLKETKEQIQKYEMKVNKFRAEKTKRNQELDLLTAENKELHKTFELKEAQLRSLEKQQRENIRIQMETMKKELDIAKLQKDLNDLLTDIETMRQDLTKELHTKKGYLNILDDMTGNVKIVCRCRNGAADEFHIDGDHSITISSRNDQMVFQFDQCYGPQSSNSNVFEIIEYLYNKAMEGFNCYIVTIGGKQSGKAHTTIGENNDGLIWLGLRKIGELIKFNKLNGMTTRMFVCSVEMTETETYDLIAGNINNNIEVKTDCFKMTLLRNANYKECFTEEDVRKMMTVALNNRAKANNRLQSKDTVFVLLITFQVYSKFQHRYWKGKVAHVKLASFNTMQSLNSELEVLINGGDMHYERPKINQLLEDTFGGSSRTCVIGNINPSPNHRTETINMLKLVSQFRRITNECHKNSEPEEIFRLKNDIERLLRGIKMEIL